MSLDNWVAIDEAGHTSEITVPEPGNAKQATPTPLKDPKSRLLQKKSSSLPQLSEPHVSELKHEPTSENAPSISKELNELQQIGKDLYETNMAMLHTKVTALVESATSNSYMAFGHLRDEFQKAIAKLADGGDATSGDTRSGALNSRSQPAMHNSAGQQEVLLRVNEEVKQCLLPQLVEAGVPRFNGKDFGAWYEKASLVFDAHLPNTTSYYFCGVKLFSEPAVAALLDNLEIDSALAWDEAKLAVSDYLDSYFQRVAKYQEVASSLSV